jgi:hypothetical protein
MRSLHQVRPQDWVRKTLTTLGKAYRVVQANPRGGMVDWIVNKLMVERWSIPEIKAVLSFS